MMARVLVVYATKSGSAEGVARSIGDGLAEDGHAVVVSSADDSPDPAGFDAVFVGSGVRVGTWHASARRWLAAHAAVLQTVPVALFTVCLTMATDPDKAAEVRAYTDTLIAESSLIPVEIGVFAGMNDPARFSLAERLVMKAMKAPVGDFRDPDAAASWARATATEMGIA